MGGLSRRDVLKVGGLSLASLVSPSFAFRVMEPVVKVENPMLYYPNRD